MRPRNALVAGVMVLALVGGGVAIATVVTDVLEQGQGDSPFADTRTKREHERDPTETLVEPDQEPDQERGLGGAVGPPRGLDGGEGRDDPEPTSADPAPEAPAPVDDVVPPRAPVADRRLPVSELPPWRLPAPTEATVDECIEQLARIRASSRQRWRGDWSRNERLHRLVDSLPSEELLELQRQLEERGGPLSGLLLRAILRAEHEGPGTLVW